MTRAGDLIYLDNAATSFPKPKSVVEAVQHAMLQLAAAGRGSHRLAEQADRVVAETREQLGRLFLVDSSRFIFCQSGTDALNLVLLGYLNPGDHVVVTQAGHNSVLRPIHDLVVNRQLKVSCVSCDELGQVQAEDIMGEVKDETRLVILTHVSNVTGAIEPVEEIARILGPHRAALLVDASQSAGHLSLDLGQLPIDFLATSGHKGLLGPLGTGVAYIREGFENKVQPLRYGGTGSSSDEAIQPNDMPTKYEAGNLNVPAIAGLGAGLRYLEESGLDSIRTFQAQWSSELAERLSILPGVQLKSPTAAEAHVGPTSFTVDGFDSREFSAILDGSFGLQLRAGFHCAAEIHKALETEKTGGTVRVSPGPMTTEHALDRLVEAMKSILGV